MDRSHKLTWGMIAGATAFCTGPYAFTVIRFLLGLAEAGFYPGLVPNFTEARVNQFLGFRSQMSHLPTISDTRASAILGTSKVTWP